MPTSARIAFLLLLLVVPARREVTDDAAGTAPFLVAALRRDGIVIPFAAFDGKNWKAPWPEEIAAKDVPADLESIPREWWGKTGPLAQLAAWANGVSRGVIRLHLGKPARLALMCDARVGLASESPEWAAATREMTVDFDEAEERAARTFTAWLHPFSNVARRRYPPRIEAMYGAPMDEAGWTAYYLEAVREYPPGPGDLGCGLVTSANGWMAVGPNGKRSFDLRARITYCDREGVRYMLPLGLIKAGERNYWAYQMSGFGREAYLIVRPRPKEIVSEVQYSAGLCPF